MNHDSTGIFESDFNNLIEEVQLTKELFHLEGNVDKEDKMLNKCEKITEIYENVPFRDELKAIPDISNKETVPGISTIDEGGPNEKTNEEEGSESNEESIIEEEQGTSERSEGSFKK